MIKASVAAILLLSAAVAQAQTAVSLDLPAQPLAESLRMLGKSTDTNILIDPELVRNLRAPAVRANLTTKEALLRLLDGTGITYRFTDEHTVILEAPAPRANSEPVGASTLSEVVVTGSSIRGLQIQTSPVIMIDRGTIDRSGYQTMQDFIRTIPQAFAGGTQGASADGNLGAGANAGNNNEHAVAVNLRGLGENATLTLLNGHRMAPSAFGNVVDLSAIPLSAVERIDVLTDGASAIYGADAVAGVVNVILRKDFEGAETRASYGRVTSGGLDDQIYSQFLGHSWGSGSLMGAFEYEHMSTLPTSARDFTADSPQPTNLINPTTRQTLLLNGHQAISEQLDLQGDVLASWKTTRNVLTRTVGSSTEILVDPHAINAHVGAAYALPGNWQADFGGLYARQRTNVGSSLYFGQVQPFRIMSVFTSTIRSGDLQVSGPVLRLPSGEVKLAAGVSRRNEASSNFHGDPTIGRDTDAERHVTAEFLELNVPLYRVVLSAAVRRDDYSDFGATSNPKLGLRWTITPSLDFRANWSKAFRPPTAGELLFGDATGSSILTYPFAAPSGSGTVPIFALSGSNAQLSAENSRNLNVGFDFTPTSLPELHLGVSAYEVTFRNRIVRAPFDLAALQHPEIYGSLISTLPDDAAASAYLADVLAGGGVYYNLTGTGATGVRYIFDLSQTNASIVKQNGADFAGEYRFSLGENRLRTALNVAYINKIETQYGAGAVARNSVSTYAQPLRFRTRAEVSWERGLAELTTAVNNSPSYTDTAVVPNEPIASWTTVDLSLALDFDRLTSSFLPGVVARLSVLNVFDRDPPRIAGGAGSINGVHYDVGNASALGRFVSVEVRKTW